jgi:hypothetical protein
VSTSAARRTAPAQIDRLVEEALGRAAVFSSLGAAPRAALLRECMDRTVAVAEAWARTAAEAKGLAWGTPAGAEDWLTGPLLLVRNARLLATSLEAIARQGKPPLGRRVRWRDDGRLEVEVFPTSTIDGIAYFGYRGSALLLPGVDEVAAGEAQASRYGGQSVDPAVCAVLGAGNVSSIPATDVLYKLFVEGQVCVLKMNPVNDYVGPFLEQALQPLIANGFLRVVYGGAEEGAYLVHHRGVDEVHVTGSAATYDLIVWGQPGPERERRKRERDPVLKKRITAELGNVTPVIVVPAHYSERELRFQARAVASATVNNASFNCNAAKMLVVGRGWPQREPFLHLVRQALIEAGPRACYYPGAAQRYEELLAGRDNVAIVGARTPGALPWALVRDLDPENRSERLFLTEPFCAILSETALPEDDPVRFLAAASRFCNERLWGTLCAEVIAPRDPSLMPALEEAIRELRYGTVSLNCWPAISYAIMSTPWGGHPSASHADIQSGLGWVHNTYLLGRVEKAVFRGPLVPRLKPLWHFDHRRTHLAAPHLVELEHRPGGRNLAAAAARTIRG